MQSFSTRRTQPRILVALAAVLALIMGVIVAVNAPKAHAAEVQPTVSNLDLTDFAGNPVDTVTKTGAYKLSFDFEIPDAEPGDTFTVQLPEGFKAPAATVALGDIATATRIGEDLIEVSFTNAVAELENLTGGFSYLLRYDGDVEDGELVDTETIIGNEAVYIPEVGFSTTPGPDPMIINKWSGTNVSGVNDFEVVRLSGNYGYTEVKPVDGQTFAKWFVELNGWNTHDPQDAGELGDNIIVTDTLQSLGDFTPQLEQSPRPEVSRVLNQDELDGLLVGPFVKSRQDGAWGNSTVEVRVRDRNMNIVTLHADVDDDAQFLTITENEDGSTTLELLLSDFLKAQYPNLTDDQKAILDDSKAQYSMAYIAVLPKQSASIINDASFTSSKVPGEFSDKGSYTYVSVDGWGEGEFKAQPTTAVGVQKTWVGLADDEVAPAVTFSLLANGEPALDLDQNPVAPITFEPGTTAGGWEGLPTQLVKGEPITYTVVEEPIDGFETVYGDGYTVDLNATTASGLLEVTNTKTEEETPGPEPTPSTTVTETTTETVPCDCTPVTETETETVTEPVPTTVTETESEPVPTTVTETETESTTVTETESEPVPTTVTETETEPVPTTVTETPTTTATEVETTTETATTTPTVTVTETTTTTSRNDDEFGVTTPPTTTETVTETATETTTETPTPAEDGSSTGGSSEGSSENEVLNRCIANAVASPLLWLVPVGVIAGVAGKALQPFAADFASGWSDLTRRLGMGGRYDNAFEQLTRNFPGNRGVVGRNNDPFREQRQQAERFVAELGQGSSAAGQGVRLPQVDVAEFGRVAGPIAAIIFAGAVAAYWCTTPEGETLGAQLSS